MILSWRDAGKRTSMKFLKEHRLMRERVYMHHGSFLPQVHFVFCRAIELPHSQVSSRRKK